MRAVGGPLETVLRDGNVLGRGQRWGTERSGLVYPCGRSLLVQKSRKAARRGRGPEVQKSPRWRDNEGKGACFSEEKELHRLGMWEGHGSVAEPCVSWKVKCRAEQE